jgi:hypothetical protein
MQRISRREWLRRVGLPFLGTFGAVALACRSRVSPLAPEPTPPTGTPAAVARR